MTWQQYFKIYRFTQEREDYRMGVIASLLGNIYRDKTIKPDPFKPVDFMPDFNTQTKELQEDTPELMKFKLHILFMKGG